MSFAITAELPLGTYRGAGADGQPEPIPSVARLHAALLAAAGFGPRAVVQSGELGPSNADEQALRWLEEHPPDNVTIPPLTVNRGQAIAYRDDGTIKQAKGQGRTKKFPKTADAAVAVGGPLVWMWREPPPPSVRAALGALCGDVGYLGTTESPVRLAANDGGDAQPTHQLDRTASMFTPGGLTIDTATVGRTRELTEAHARRTLAPRSESRSGYGTDEWSLSDVPPRQAVEPLGYAPIQEPEADVPWDRVILVPLSRRICSSCRVRWAVAVHRALIRLIGEGAPPLITGVYPPGTPRPANRLAVQFLAPTMPVEGGLASPAALALLVPPGTGAGDLHILADAVESLSSVRGPRGRLARRSGRVQVLPGTRLWQPPIVGRQRLWHTEPAAVPTRAARWTAGALCRRRCCRRRSCGSSSCRRCPVEAANANAALPQLQHPPVSRS